MKKFILKLASKICYKLSEKISVDLNKNDRNDLLELGDKLLAIANTL